MTGPERPTDGLREGGTAVGLFDITQNALDQALLGSSMRQKAIADNLANANTPGFHRSDVDFQSTLADALGSGATADQISQVQFTVAPDNAGPQRADGNNVQVDAEMAKLNENAVTYQALVAVAKARLSMLSIAIGGR
jgi:flagellar basal-body rod protein FlgB